MSAREGERPEEYENNKSVRLNTPPIEQTPQIRDRGTQNKFELKVCNEYEMNIYFSFYYYSNFGLSQENHWPEATDTSFSSFRNIFVCVSACSCKSMFVRMCMQPLINY